MTAATFTPTRTRGAVEGWIIIITEGGRDRLARDAHGTLALFTTRTAARAAAGRMRKGAA